MGCLFGFFFYVLILEIDVVCKFDFIEVFLKILDFFGIVFNDFFFYFEDRNCVFGYKDNMKVMFKFGFEDCSIKYKNDGEKIYYMNKVYFKVGEVVEDEVIICEYMEIIFFYCGYNKKVIFFKVLYNLCVV